MMLFLTIFAGLMALYSIAAWVSVLRDKQSAPRDIDTPRIWKRGAMYLPPDIRTDFRYLGPTGPTGCTGPTGPTGPTGFTGYSLSDAMFLRN